MGIEVPRSDYSGFLKVFCLACWGVAAIGIFSASGCQEKTQEAAFKLITAPQENRDFYLPSKLWDELIIEDAEQAELKKMKKVNQEESLRNSTMIFAPVAVEMIEKTPGTLIEPRIRVEFKNGGGTIDFAKYRGPKTGTFFLRLDFDAYRDGQYYRIFYLSGGRARKVDGMIVGSGCRSYFDIGSSFAADMKGPGIPLNTTRHLHASAIGGHILVSWFADSQLNVSQVYFTDSEREDLFCPAVRGDLQ